MAILIALTKKLSSAIQSSGLLIHTFEDSASRMYVQGSHTFAMFSAHALHVRGVVTRTYKRDDH